MTRYEELMNKADECEQKALEAKDLNLKAFYHNACNGFRNKANKLTVQEAGELAE